MSDKKIAVILVNYNGVSDTLTCIESIKNSTVDCQIIVVDNSSSQNELKVIEDFFPEVIGIQSKINGGFSYGNNFGIRMAIERKYEYILLLNNDTVIDKNMIKFLLSYASENTITVPSMFYYSNPETLWYGGGYIDKWTGRGKHKRMNKKLNVDLLKPEECTFATGCCMLISSNILKNIGLLDESFFMYCEDTEFCIRAIQSGVIIKYIPRAKLWHKVSDSTGGSNSPFAIYYMTRNRLMYIEMHKSFFWFTAKFFSLFTRLLKAKFEKEKEIKEAFIMGIRDFRKGIKGQAKIW